MRATYRPNEILTDTLVLTTEHSASSYGVPVLLIDGEPYGPGDLTPYGPARGLSLMADNPTTEALDLLDRWRRA